MSKANWDGAPSWANYVAMDQDGDWWWFEEKPVAENSCWCNKGAGRAEFISSEDWVATLEQRP